MCISNVRLKSYDGIFINDVAQEIMLQRVMSHIAAVKKDMIILEKSEFSALLAENEVSERM